MQILQHNSVIKKLFFITLMMISASADAQDVVQSTSNQTNLLKIAMTVTAIVLVPVIGLLAQVLLTLSKFLLKKRKAELGLKIIILIIFSSMLSSTATAQDILNNTESITSNYFGGMREMEFYALTTVISIELIVILYLTLIIRRTFTDLSEEDNEKIPSIKKTTSLSTWWKNLDKKWMTKSVPIEKEADILLDHDYDGIRELDNALPPWWKYGFYVTIVVAIIYMFLYHVTGSGKNPEQEYAAEMAEGKKIEEQYKAKTKSLVDENNITLSDADGSASGKALYNQSCIACHGASGEGGIGPNLTDNYWIHGGSLNMIYQTIKIGYPEKGMQSWQSMYSPIQIKNLTSFVKSIVGTKPSNPKAPQGNLEEQ